MRSGMIGYPPAGCVSCGFHDVYQPSESDMSSEAKCPFTSHAAAQAIGGGATSKDWWPNQLRVDLLNQHSEK